MREDDSDLMPEADLRAAFRPLLPDPGEQLRRVRARVATLEEDGLRTRRAFTARSRWFQAAALLVLPKLAQAKGLSAGTAMSGKAAAQTSGLLFVSAPALCMLVITGLFAALLARLRRIPRTQSASGRSAAKVHAA